MGWRASPQCNHWTLTAKSWTWASTLTPQPDPPGESWAWREAPFRTTIFPRPLYDRPSLFCIAGRVAPWNAQHEWGGGSGRLQGTNHFAKDWSSIRKNNIGRLLKSILARPKPNEWLERASAQTVCRKDDVCAGKSKRTSNPLPEEHSHGWHCHGMCFWKNVKCLCRQAMRWDTKVPHAERKQNGTKLRIKDLD